MAEIEHEVPQKGSLAEYYSWAADNERLVLAGLQKTGPGPFDHDEETIEAVKQRCINRFGEYAGMTYYQGLIATFPQRHKELFPELYGPNGEDLTLTPGEVDIQQE